MKSTRLIVLFACIAICIPFYAQTELEKKAIKGDLKAQMELADSYCEKKDWKNAFKWYLKVAKQGHAYAQYNIGLFYFKVFS